MSHHEVYFKIDLPDEVEPSEQQLRDWVRFEICHEGGVSSDNPLAGYDIDDLIDPQGIMIW